MKITFIRPHLTQIRAADALEPLVFAILASLTPPDVELAFYDDRIEPIPFDQPTDLVALTVETFTAKRAYQIAARYRRRGIPVIMGGFHPTLIPEEARQYADSIILGDAENVWPEIVRDARAGRLRPRYQSSIPPALQGLRPNRGIFPRNRYTSLRLVQFGRGCRFACDFCSIHAFYGPALYQRCLEDVIAEVETVRRSYLLFVDDNLFVNERQAEELFRALIPLKIHWVCQTSIDLAQNDHLLDLMARSGCIAVFIGFESLNEANLIQMRKKWNLKQGDFTGAVRRFYQHGIMVCGSFVFGYDGDFPSDFDRTLDFARRCKLTLAQFNPLIPTPGTPLYQRLQSEGRLLYKRWWLDDDYRYGQAIFKPKNMQADELTEGCFRLRREFNSYGSIFQRALAPQMNARSPHHLLAYLAANLVSRRDSQQTGRAFGGRFAATAPGNGSRMKILLILPSDNLYRYRGLANKLIGPYAPLTLVTLAALVPNELDAQIDILDEGIQQPDYENKHYDVVGITCVSSSANRAYRLAEYWRGRGAFVVIGGAHATLMPEEAGQHADAVVVGLAEETWPQLLRDYKGGTPKKRYQAHYSGVLSRPPPRRDLFPRLGYLPAPTIVANRGCQNHCFFCVVNQAEYARRVVRPIPEVVAEIQSLHTRHMIFLDPNLVSDREYAKSLLQALIPLKLKWMAPAPSDLVQDKEMFGLMVRSGCEGVLIGFESFSQASLDRSGKNFNQVTEYKKIVTTLHAHGISVSGCFVLGFDDDTLEMLAQTAEVVYEIGIDFPRYALLTPFPGSRLFKRFKNAGRLLTEDWSLYDSQHVVFRPRHMSAGQLQQVFSDTLKQSFSYQHIFHRTRIAPHSPLLSLMANWGLREALTSAWKEEAGKAPALAREDL